MLTNHCDIMNMRKLMLMSEYIMHSFHFLPCTVIVSVPVCWPTILIAGSNTLINHHHSSFCHHWKPHFHYFRISTFQPNGQVTVPKRMNFRKNSKPPMTPPHFRKIMLQLFLENVREKLYIKVQICNMNFWIENDHPPLWHLSESSSDLVAAPSLVKY